MVRGRAPGPLPAQGPGGVVGGFPSGVLRPLSQSHCRRSHVHTPAHVHRRASRGAHAFTRGCDVSVHTQAHTRVRSRAQPVPCRTGSSPCAHVPTGGPGTLSLSLSKGPERARASQGGSKHLPARFLVSFTVRVGPVPHLGVTRRPQPDSRVQPLCPLLPPRRRGLRLRPRDVQAHPETHRRSGRTSSPGCHRPGAEAGLKRHWPAWAAGSPRRLPPRRVLALH